MNQMCNIVLPRELILRICDFVDAETVFSLMLTCREVKRRLGLDNLEFFEKYFTHMTETDVDTILYNLFSFINKTILNLPEYDPYVSIVYYDIYEYGSTTVNYELRYGNDTRHYNLFKGSKPTAIYKIQWKEGENLDAAIYEAYAMGTRYSIYSLECLKEFVNAIKNQKITLR